MGEESKRDLAEGARLQQLHSRNACWATFQRVSWGLSSLLYKALFTVSILKIQYNEDLQTLKGQENTIYSLALLRKCLL